MWDTFSGRESLGYFEPMTRYSYPMLETSLSKKGFAKVLAWRSAVGVREHSKRIVELRRLRRKPRKLHPGAME